MQAFRFRIRGRWAHFRRPDTNNNPLTHDFITKTALLGLGGAVLGWDRQRMRQAFPLLSEDLIYGCCLNSAVKKESWSFTLRNAAKPDEKSPRPMEFLRDPYFTVVLALQQERSKEFFTGFAAAIENSEACYTPVLGLHNCPAELEWGTRSDAVAQEGEYYTRGFFLRREARLTSGLLSGVRLGFDRIPTYQNDAWWNLPDRYEEVVYPTSDTPVLVEGEHYLFQNEAWNLI